MLFDYLYKATKLSIMKAPFTLALLLSVVGYQPWALYLAEVCEELGPQLSKSAVISAWDATRYERWIKSNAPTPGVVVTPATEQDVAAIVCCSFVLNA